MSQPKQQVVVVHESNSFGTAGFICAILGLFTCGILSPVGFLLSCIGLLYRPRGYAFAGFLLSGGFALIMFFGGFAFIMGIVGLGAAGTAMAPPTTASSPTAIAPAESAPEAIAIEAPLSPTTRPEPPEPPAPAPAAEPTATAAADEPKPESKPEDKGFRQWQDASGKFSVSARFVSLRDNVVSLRRQDNDKVITIPVEKLCDADKQWLRERHEKSGIKVDIP